MVGELFDGNATDPGCAVIGLHPFPRRFQVRFGKNPLQQALIWVERFHDAPHVHSSIRIHYVMGAHRGSSLLCVRPFGGVSLSRLFSFRRACFLTPTMASADSCPVAPHVAMPGATPTKELQTGQVSPDKDVNFDYATAAFTVSPESRALSCCADLPGDSALYAVSVRRLIALHSGFLWTVPRGSALAFG